MKERGVTQPDVKKALTKGQVVLEDRTTKDITWRVAGHDVDGNPIEVVVAVFGDRIVVKVITVIV